MHILVTDATGTARAAGCTAADRCRAHGHAALLSAPHPCLDPDVEFVCAPLSDPVLQELADEADAVIHLAPVEHQRTRQRGHRRGGACDPCGRPRRCPAAVRVPSRGPARAVSSRPRNWCPRSWAPSLVVRIAPPVGRQLDWMVCRTVATLLRTKVSSQPMRVLHLDDLVRFLVLALNTDRTGVVDLATPDTTNVITAWRLLRSVDPRSRLHRVRSWPQLIPEMDIAAAQEDWRFEFGWQALDAVADTARGLVGRRLARRGRDQPRAPTGAAGGGRPAPAPSDELRSAGSRRAWRASSTTGSIPGSRFSVQPRPRRGAARATDPDNAGRPAERAAYRQPGDGSGAGAWRRGRSTNGGAGPSRCSVTAPTSGCRPTSSPPHQLPGWDQRRRRPQRPGRPAAGRGRAAVR